MAEAKKEGNWGEEVACSHLVAQGYGIVAQNWRMGHLEIDIVAADSKNIVFVEVKTRQNPEDDPIEAVTPRKMALMVRAADTFLDINNFPQTVRFDIIGITGSRETGVQHIEHIVDAFDPPIG